MATVSPVPNAQQAMAMGGQAASYPPALCASVVFVTEARSKVVGFRVPINPDMTVKQLAFEAVYRLSKTVLSNKAISPKEVVVKTAYVTDECSLFYPDKVVEVVDIRSETIFLVLKGWQEPKLTTTVAPPAFEPPKSSEAPAPVIRTIPDNAKTFSPARKATVLQAVNPAVFVNAVAAPSSAVTAANSIAAGIKRQVSDRRQFNATVEMLAASPQAGANTKTSKPVREFADASAPVVVSMPHPSTVLKRNYHLPSNTVIQPTQLPSAPTIIPGKQIGAKTTRSVEEEAAMMERGAKRPRAERAAVSTETFSSAKELKPTSQLDLSNVHLSQMTTPERDEFYEVHKESFGKWGPEAHKYFPKDYAQNPDDIIREARKARKAQEMAEKAERAARGEQAPVVEKKAKKAAPAPAPVAVVEEEAIMQPEETTLLAISPGNVKLADLPTPERLRFYKENKESHGTWGSEAHKYFDANYESNPDAYLRRKRLAAKMAAKERKENPEGKSAATAVAADDECPESTTPAIVAADNVVASVKTVAAPGSVATRNANTQPHTVPPPTNRSPASINADNLVGMSLANGTSNAVVSRSLLTAYDDDIVELVTSGPQKKDVIEIIVKEVEVKKEGWGVEAHRFFDPTTYSSDPKKAIIPEEVLRQPIRTRRQLQLLAEQQQQLSK